MATSAAKYDMEAPVTFQSSTLSLDPFFIPCLKSANEANPSAKQNPGDSLKKFWNDCPLLVGSHMQH